MIKEQYKEMEGNEVPYEYFTLQRFVILRRFQNFSALIIAYITQAVLQQQIKFIIDQLLQ